MHDSANSANSDLICIALEYYVLGGCVLDFCVHRVSKNKDSIFSLILIDMPHFCIACPLLARIVIPPDGCHLLVSCMPKRA